MIILKSFIYYLIICWLQYWFAEHFRFLGLSLDFTLMACVTSVNILSPAHSMMFSFLLGFFLDFSSWGHFGLYCLSYTLISYLLILMKSRTDLTSPFSRAVIFLTFFYVNLIFYSTVYFAIYKLWFFGWKNFIIAPLINVLFFGFFYKISERYLSEKKCL